MGEHSFYLVTLLGAGDEVSDCAVEFIPGTEKESEAVVYYNEPDSRTVLHAMLPGGVGRRGRIIAMRPIDDIVCRHIRRES